MSEKFKVQQSLSSGNDSAMKRYMELVFGQDSILGLFRFEFVMLIAGKRSGALGLVLRKLMYPWILGSVGRNVIFGSSITIRHPHKIHLGDGVVVDDNVMLDAKGESNRGITLGDGVFIGRNSILSCKDGDITMDTNANLGFNCLITSTNLVHIGEDNIIAAYTYLVGGGTYKVDGITTPIRENYDYQLNGGVTTKENVWIGTHVTVLDGVTIESGSVIGAGSLVSRSVPENTIAAGSPAVAKRKRR